MVISTCSNQTTRTQHLAVMTISLAGITDEGWSTTVDKKVSKALFESDNYLIISMV